MAENGASWSGGILRALAVGLFMLGYYVYKKFTGDKKGLPENAVAVGKVKSLSVYPVKSFRHIDVSEAQCTRKGLAMTTASCVGDRTWMVISDSNNFVSQRQEPRMALIQPSAPDTGEVLQLDAPDMPPLRVSKQLTPQTSPIVDVKVWGEPLQALDCGDEAADWIQTFLKKPGFRFVFSAPSMKKRLLHEGPTADHKKFQPDDEISNIKERLATIQVVFPDLGPLLLFSEASVDDVNARLSDTKITEYNFRPNIYVTDCKAFEEDSWKDIYIGETKLRNVKKCDRCLLTTVDPTTGEKDPKGQPLETLRTYRKLVPEYGNSPCFGVLLTVLDEGLINVGDVIYAVKD